MLLSCGGRAVWGVLGRLKKLKPQTSASCNLKTMQPWFNPTAPVPNTESPEIPNRKCLTPYSKKPHTPLELPNPKPHRAAGKPVEMRGPYGLGLRVQYYVCSLPRWPCHSGLQNLGLRFFESFMFISEVFRRTRHWPFLPLQSHHNCYWLCKDCWCQRILVMCKELSPTPKTQHHHAQAPKS